MKWSLMFDHISLSKQPCSPSVRKHLRIRVKQLSPGPLMFLLVHCHQGIFSSWSPGCPSPSDIQHSLRLLPSRPPTHPHVRWCLRVKLALCLCACVYASVFVCMCVYIHRTSWRLEAINWLWEEGELSSPSWPAKLRQSGVISWQGSWDQVAWDRREPQPAWRPSFTLKTQAGWGLGSSSSDDGNLAFPTSLFFLLPLPDGVPRSACHHPPSSVLLARLSQAQQPPSNTLAFYLHSFSPSPSGCPPSYPATRQNHNLSEPLSSTSKGQSFLTFPSEFPTLLASLPFSFPPFHPFFSLSGFFPFCTFFSFTLGSGLN